ncbi:MAG: M23 family metallopeptidase [Armatimonadetes bacterium]|nr:MAG: M23 family metallopeptidase [Armatimonadota bacterium]
MLLDKSRKLLPKKLNGRVALNRFVFQHRLLKLWGFKKPLIHKTFSRITKIVAAVSFLLYFTGYQPTLAIPPVKRNIVHAAIQQQQTIDAASLSIVFNLPHPGYLTTSYNRWHPGIDIATGLGMPVRPVARGTVVETIFGFWGYGNHVIVDHPEGFRSLYAHMGRIFVQKGASVSAVTILGEVGVTGRTTGPHTHFELQRFGQYIDPQTVLPILPNLPLYTYLGDDN